MPEEPPAAGEPAGERGQAVPSAEKPEAEVPRAEPVQPAVPADKTVGNRKPSGTTPEELDYWVAKVPENLRRELHEVLRGEFREVRHWSAPRS